MSQPDPIITSNLSKSSSSTLSVSPSTSVLLSRPRYRTSKTPSIPPTTTTIRNTKLEQIIQNFYTKTAQIIIQSRISNEILKGGLNSRRKTNKWFNIATDDYENLKEELKFWKSFIKHHKDEEPPPLVIDIYLETTEPELLHEGDNVRGWHKLNLGVQRILIESWTLCLNHPLPEIVVDLPNLYKRSIVFFRSLHSLVRLLPSHNLYQKYGEISLGYRLSTLSLNHVDEVPLDYPLTKIDTTQLYEFKEVVTPLGTFKLGVLYRKYCQFDTREDIPTTIPSQPSMDVEENYFTPTMAKYRETVQSKIPPTTLYPSLSSSRHRVQSFRSIPSRNAYPSTTSLERRISAPLVQPFKSPSLSSSPHELMYPSRSQTPEKRQQQQQQQPVESGSLSRKIEFSSSFERFKHLNSSDRFIPPPDMMRRGSRTSDHSSIYMESEEEEDLEEFMKLMGTNQELKLFQQIGSIYLEKETTPQEESQKTLSHFKSVQETHPLLSMGSSITSLESSKGLNLPVKPSPLHTTASATTTLIKPSSDEVVYTSPLKNRKAFPLPPPPVAPTTQHREDDDLLVFKMSELNGEDDTTTNKRPAATGIRRIHSSGNIPNTNHNTGKNVLGYLSDDGKSSNNQPPTKLTHRLFYDK
ncbi:autophagy-related protein 13-domain-containing protein [Pilaira anomala]|nr:autophagy-related protein 13-domain-containing protein [Pilaira anomala]